MKKRRASKTNPLSQNYQGNFEESLRLYTEWHRTAVENNNVQHQSFGLFGQVENHLPVGDSAAAQISAEEGLKILVEKAPKTTENRTLAIRGYGLLALSLVRNGQIQHSLEAADQAKEIVDQLSAPSRVTLLEGISGMVETYLVLWERALQDPQNKSAATLHARVRESMKSLERFAHVFNIGEPQARLWRGRDYWLQGNTGKAREVWSLALKAAEHLAMPHDQALICLELGRRLPREEGLPYLLLAKELFTAFNAYHGLRLAQEALDTE